MHILIISLLPLMLKNAKKKDLDRYLKKIFQNKKNVQFFSVINDKRRFSCQFSTEFGNHFVKKKFQNLKLP